jgi:deoxyadenosine/deoxycytidine kinase
VSPVSPLLHLFPSLNIIMSKMIKDRIDPVSVHVVVLGIIGAGKSTLVRKIENRISEYGKKCISVEEPVNAWKTSGLLEDLYKNPVSLAAPFQMMAFSDRLLGYDKLREEKNKDVEYLISDGHILLDRYVYTENFIRRECINEEQLKVYSRSFSTWQKLQPVATPTLILFIDVSPETCLKRIKEVRKRPEEMSISLDYLKGLDTCLNDLFEKLSVENNGILPNSVKVCKVNGEKSKKEILEEAIDQIDGLVGSGYGSKHEISFNVIPATVTQNITQLV